MKNADRYGAPGALSLVVISLLLPPLAAGQSDARRPATDIDLFGDRDRASSLSIVQPKGPALESVIAPEGYYVGPSDGFSVNVWASPPFSYQLTVTPEGTLIIPTVGEIRVAGLTLRAAREKCLDAIQRRYLRSEATMTLVTPRPILVTVQGEVLNPGTYTMQAYNRVDKVIEEANRLQVAQQSGQLTLQLSARRDVIREQMSRRRITVRHNDGSRDNADIPKYLATKDDRWDPYLREGDIVVVPTNNFARNVFGVYGEVNSPGRYEFAEGDSVRDAIRIAYGFSPHARPDSVELTRQDPDGVIVLRKIVDARGIMNGSAPDVAMQPGDALLVPGSADRRGDYRVEVKGEVLYPGMYPISRDRTTLTEVIRSAGGFTENASLELAEVLRRPVTASDKDLERLESLSGGVPPEDSSYYFSETNLRLKKGAVEVDFVKLFRDRDTTRDIFLRDEDVVDVPSTLKTVYVFGQVVNPGYVGFVPGEDVWYYIRKAGGTTDRAREGDIRLVKARTRQWHAPGDVALEEGDLIWVPKNPERPFSYYLNVVAQSAAIISVALSAALVVIQLRK